MARADGHLLRHSVIDVTANTFMAPNAPPLVAFMRDSLKTSRLHVARQQFTCVSTFVDLEREKSPCKVECRSAIFSRPFGKQDKEQKAREQMARVSSELLPDASSENACVIPSSSILSKVIFPIKLSKAMAQYRCVDSLVERTITIIIMTWSAPSCTITSCVSG